MKSLKFTIHSFTLHACSLTISCCRLFLSPDCIYPIDGRHTFMSAYELAATPFFKMHPHSTPEVRPAGPLQLASNTQSTRIHPPHAFSSQQGHQLPPSPLWWHHHTTSLTLHSSELSVTRKLGFSFPTNLKPIMSNLFWLQVVVGLFVDQWADVLG